MRLLVDKKGRRYLVRDGDDLHCNYGMVSKEDIFGCELGDLVKSNKGEYFNVVEPDIVDFIAKAKRGPQAMTLKDMGLAVAYSGIRSGSKVFESGTGSGLFTMYLAHIVYPAEVVTYEVREDFSKIALKNFKKFGFENIRLQLRDTYDGIDEEGLDACFLDLAEPWLAIEACKKALKVGGRVVSYSPSINQSCKLKDVLDGFQDETFETLLRYWKASKMSPDTRMLGHTGFLTVARKMKK